MTGTITGVNPIVLMATGLLSLIGSFFVRSLPVALVTLAAYGFVAFLVVPAWRYAVLCLALTGFAGATVAYSTWRLGGHDLELAAVAGLRIVILAWPGAVAAGFIDPARLGDYLGQSLKLPARGVVAFSAALQRFAGFTQTWTTLERTRRSRGLRRSPGPLAFALLVDALRGASRSAVAMDARGFARAHSRTWLYPADWTRADVVGLILAAMLGLLPVAVALIA